MELGRERQSVRGLSGSGGGPTGGGTSTEDLVVLGQNVHLEESQYGVGTS